MVAEADQVGWTLEGLRLAQLRNVQAATLEGLTRCVVIRGGNGAGKTTLLEAIYLLVRGRTFRGRKAGELVQRGCRELAVTGRFRSGRGDALELGFRQVGRETARSITPSRWSLDGAERLPVSVKLIGESSQILIEGAPDLRRRLLDWNMFHVEQSGWRAKAAFQRVLAQRNAALRHTIGSASIWDRAYVEAAERLDAFRRSFFEAWKIALLGRIASLNVLRDLEFCYQRGWRDGTSLAEGLVAGTDADQERGFTTIGPHRADLQFHAAGSHQPSLSRGQTKLLVCLLQLAAEDVHRSYGIAPTIWLVDDLAAELDEQSFALLWSAFRDTGSQIIVTEVARQSRPLIPTLDPGSTRLFHVEHGRVTPADD